MRKLILSALVALLLASCHGAPPPVLGGSQPAACPEAIALECRK